MPSRRVSCHHPFCHPLTYLAYSIFVLIFSLFPNTHYTFSFLLVGLTHLSYPPCHLSNQGTVCGWVWKLTRSGLFMLLVLQSQLKLQSHLIQVARQDAPSCDWDFSRSELRLGCRHLPERVMNVGWDVTEVAYHCGPVPGWRSPWVTVTRGKDVWMGIGDGDSGSGVQGVAKCSVGHQCDPSIPSVAVCSWFFYVVDSFFPLPLSLQFHPHH